ncbi:sulfite exporter TauE/SafE family protein [Peptostreptococcaceae bacterium AGR-M142]
MNLSVAQILLGILGLFAVVFGIYFIIDFAKHKDQLEDHNSWLKVLFIGFITDFFDTLGIGSFAPTTALVRGMKQVKDQFLPGTLNVSHTIPVVLEAFIFIAVVEVEPITLGAMLAAATVGAYVGAGFVSRLPEKKVQLAMAIALFVTAGLMLMGQLDLMPGGGEAIGLSGAKLIIAIVANFILGALMTAGIGLYAPCMALVYLLGMSPKVAFPIMMGSCAFLMPAASVKFVKEGAYDRRASMGITIGGCIGVFVAVKFVTGMDINMLTKVVIAVIFYTSYTMFKAASKNQEKAA